MIYIGSARHDENGNYANGAAGDQDHTEVSTQQFYVHSKGWYVLRAKSVDVAEKIRYAMQAACDNDNIGYDQNQRNTLYSIVKPLGFDPMRVTAKCETDCSALVRVCCNYAGIPVGDFTTSNEVDVLDSTGYFNAPIAYEKGMQLFNGDILVTKTKGHTAIVTSGGIRSPYPIGWNKNEITGEWWYQYGPNEPDFYSNQVKLIGSKYYAFDKHGYMIEGEAVISTNKDGEIISVEKY